MFFEEEAIGDKNLIMYVSFIISRRNSVLPVKDCNHVYFTSKYDTIKEHLTKPIARGEHGIAGTPRWQMPIERTFEIGTKTSSIVRKGEKRLIYLVIDFLNSYLPYMYKC